MKKVIVKNSAEHKFRKQVQWVYKNEIKKYPKDIQKGEIVEIFSPAGKFLGLGYFNPLSKISLRVLSFFRRKDIPELIRSRIINAINRRKELAKITDAYRIVHSEADLLPGLTVDYYRNYLSIQINTAGMERLRDTVIETLIDVIKPEGIYDKSDQKVRKIEGLETENKTLYGHIPDKIKIKEYSTEFFVYLKEGQKTGAYLDQRANRKIVSDFVQKGFRVLDLFCNTGGFGIHAYKKGADFVKFVDISDIALKQVEENCHLNNIQNFETVNKNVFDFLKEEKNKGEKYDLIILDPPSFAKTKHEKVGALRGFKYLILNSLKLLKEGGFLSVFSCSYHISMDDLINLSIDASADSFSVSHIKKFLYQDVDHPVLLNMPETLYLKGFILKKL
ncbi:SAM-dependent methyltransferase [Persephonella hydrogeniphila]|uniref:SAM-dependent methyltransferase n=1 Tax=Persephonella hydrogeniphila TaxID=198703 RepID=A0A285NNU0_9AQUI|nr:class I SAM-dependent rRNA methyltransferase [Persephonella hydrogeniphila]SNZ09526.1 SAM-dependent methyltransferase [Persephonella hydrogeniphila]